MFEIPGPCEMSLCYLISRQRAKLIESEGEETSL